MEAKKFGHKFSYNSKKYAHSMALSKYVRVCKDKVKQTPKISWKIIKSAPAHKHLKKMHTFSGGKDGHNRLPIQTKRNSQIKDGN